ncbi:6-phosphogluconolactonase [Erythrobacter sp. SCSIO 43205]|uniref:6-phosphogluconolactonase n=1 Tax=Erythrobacter sp. SCSIO 43205 TaxID=2779361 RepID=UPI001CAA0E6B|nr:6-phosphogluconolactonase [Erythrobacter sp. SCSIO 43205]UAB77801.1 6-phosphogluconolactonase [Erythrobacter sp. SCSIO 43205]
MINVTLKNGQSANEIAQWIAGKLGEALTRTKSEIAISVPGGSTPFPIFEELVKAPLDWSRVAVWPGDDRIVPEDHDASNTGKIRAIFEPAGARVVTLGEDASPPRFTLCWMGMGGDGHIASLFPNTDPQVDDPQMVRRLTPDPLPPEAPFDRITLTIPALVNSDALMFVIRGNDKLSVFKAAMAGEHDLPIARILTAATQDVVCFT